MSTFDEVLQAARALPEADRRRLVDALGAAPPGGRAELPLAGFGAPPQHSLAWVKAEQGHAVLATRTSASDAEIPAGAAAITGMWADRGAAPGRDPEGSRA